MALRGVVHNAGRIDKYTDEIKYQDARGSSLPALHMAAAESSELG